MCQVSPHVTPCFAPLPVPMVEHLALRRRRLDRYHSSEQEAWHYLVQQMAGVRWNVFFGMAPFVQLQQHGEMGGFSSGWLLQQLNKYIPGTTPITAQTLSQWRARGLIWYREHGLPDYAAAAALLMARMIDRGERNFLPSSLTAEEQGWSCWVQTAPDVTPLAYRADRLHELPRASICWTPWMGAAWDTAWLPVKRETITSLCGAIRWSHLAVPRTTEEVLFDARRPQYYHVTLHDLRRWDPDIAALLESPAAPVDPEMLQEAATLVLRRMAPRLFAASTTEPTEK